MYKCKFIFFIISIAVPRVLFAQNIKLIEDLNIKNQHITLSKGTSPIQLKVNSDRDIFIVNKTQNSIWLYSKEGKLVKTISKPGRGPGEFMGLKDTFLSKNDTLYALDRNLAKISVFSPPKYEPEDAVHIPPLHDNQIPQKIYVIPGYHYLVSYTEQLSIQHAKQKNNRLYIVSTSGSLKGIFLKYAHNQTIVYRHRKTISTLGVPFGYKSILHTGMHGKLYYGRTNNNYIQVFYKNEKKKIHFSHKRVKVPSKIIKKISEQDGNGIFHRKMMDAIPKYMPFYTQFVVDNKDRIWLSFNTKNFMQCRLEILNQKGKEIGHTVIPRTLKLEVVRDGYAYGVKTSKNGDKSVIRYKIKGL